jgi:hypothetical protein
MNINDNSGNELAKIKTEEEKAPMFNFANLELDIDDYDSCEGGGCSV